MITPQKNGSNGRFQGTRLIEPVGSAREAMDDPALAADSIGRRLGQTKIERYGWKLKDEPGRMEYLDKKVLRVDHDYQRDKIAMQKVLGFARNWSWWQCGALVVAERRAVEDSEHVEYWIMDGQHRWLASMRRADISKLPCLVFESTGRVQEARAFIGINDDRKAVCSIDKYRARLAGGDPVAVFVQSELERVGITLTRSAPQTPMATASIALLLTRAGEDQQAFKAVLDCVADLCVESPIPEILLQGIHYIHTSITPVTDRRLRARLVQIGQARLVDAAKRAAAYYSRGGGKVFANGMLNEINKGLRNHFGKDAGEAA